MISSADTLNTARRALHNLIHHTYGDAGGAFSIDVAEHNCLPSRWLAMIQLRQRNNHYPISFSLSLEHFLPSELMPSQPTSRFEMTAMFLHCDAQYGYCKGHWYQNGTRCPAELAERFHALSTLAATTVDTTVVGVLSIGLLDAYLANPKTM